MTSSDFDPTSLTSDGDMTLVLGRRTTSNIKGHRVTMHTDVTDALRRIASLTLEELADRTPVGYSDDMALDEEANYVLVPRSELILTQPEKRRGRRAADAPPPPIIELDAAVLRMLDEASSLPSISREGLKQQGFLLYSVVVGDDSTGRVAFVKQANPYQAAQLGKIMTQFGDGLRRVSDPILSFAHDFDLVVTEEHVAILRTAAFERIFRDINSLRERIPVWSTAAIEALPLSSESESLLKESALRNSRIATQLRGMSERGFLAKKYEASDLRKQMIDCGLDAERIIKDDQLVLTSEILPLVLKIIDEKLYAGWHSETQWDVATRSRR